MRAVIKIGGSLTSKPENIRELMESIEDLSTRHLLVIVPGGGPFAENVRKLQELLDLSDSATHWMAILAMEQFGELLYQYTRKLETFSGREIGEMMLQKRSFILQPYRLVRSKDELPHTWDVTSDSIAMWVAILIGADLAVLAKSTDTGTPKQIGVEESKSLAKDGIVDAHLPMIHPNFKGRFYVIDGRRKGILDQILQ